MERSLALSMAHVVEKAAIASARLSGRGDRKHADHVATEAMRDAFNEVDFCGTIVIGEGERDEAPMLYIGEQVGTWREGTPQISIAVDPLEGTNLCATGSPNSITVLAASEAGGLIHAPDTYFDKIVVGPSCKGKVDIDAPVAQNLNAIAESLNREITDLQIVVLDRPRHSKLISEIRAAGARIKLISDGDLAPGVAAAVQGTGVHAVMGSGGAPESVITAAAMRCLGGEIVGRFVVKDDTERERMRRMGISNPDGVFRTKDLAPGEHVIFAATGVTNGDLLQGVRFFGGAARTHTLVMTRRQKMIRFLDTIHIFEEGRSPIHL